MGGLELNVEDYMLEELNKYIGESDVYKRQH